MSELMKIDIPRDELGRSMGGGLPSSSLILLEGNEGAGKSAISQRLTYGLLKNDLSVAYISTELNTMGFVEQMSSLDYNITDYLLFEKVIFIPLFPFLGKRELTDQFIDRIMKSKVLFEKDLIIFDTFSFLLIHSNVSQEKLFEFIKFLKKINSLGKTVIFCVDKDHGVDPKFSTLMKSISDIYWSVEAKVFAGQLVRVINIHRFKRAGDTIGSAIPFKIEPGRGLAIEIASFS